MTVTHAPATPTPTTITATIIGCRGCGRIWGRVNEFWVSCPNCNGFWGQPHADGCPEHPARLRERLAAAERELEGLRRWQREVVSWLRAKREENRNYPDMFDAHTDETMSAFISRANAGESSAASG